MKTYQDETIELSILRGDEIRSQFTEEVKRLLRTGAIDTENHSRGLIFGVALENIADGFLRGERKSHTYRNLKHF